MKHVTKKTLLASVLSLTLCFAMLLGTTFAWFTDKVTTGANQIISGNLEVLLLDENDQSLENSTTLFRDKNGKTDNLLWEPNATFKTQDMFVKNDGNLALKYKLILNVTGADAAKLLEVLTVTVTMGDETVDIANFEGKLTPGQKSDAIVITTHMDKNADESYENLKAELSLTVFATQLDAEFDSFGTDYDDIALVANASDLANAIAAGKNVMLTNDIAVDVSDTIVVADDANIILDLNGHEISGTSSASGKNRALFTVKGEMSVIGNGTVSMVHTGANMEWNNLSAPFSVEAGILTLGKGVNVMNFGGTDMAYAVDVNTTLGETELNVDGATLYSTYIGVRIFNNHSTAKGTVNYNSGIIYGAKNGYDIWAQLMSKPAENAVVNIADDITYTTEDKSGKMYYIADNVAYVSTAAALQSAITEGKDVVFVSDITVDKWIMFSETLSIGNGNIITTQINGLTIDGNGHSLTVNAVESAGNGNYLIYDATNLNIRNLTINMNCAGGAIGLESGVIENVVFNNGSCIFPGNGDITIKNCEFNTAAHTIYYEAARNNLKIINNTFNVDPASNVVILRGAETFTGNIVNSGRTVNIVSANATVTGNIFNTRVKLYNEGQALSGNIFKADAYIDIEDGISVDVSGNYWGGEAPSTTQIPTEIAGNVTVSNYYTTYVDGVLGGLQ